MSDTKALDQMLCRFPDGITINYVDEFYSTWLEPAKAELADLVEQIRQHHIVLNERKETIAQLRMNFDDAILRLHEMVQDTPVHNQGYEAYQNAVAFLARMKETK